MPSRPRFCEECRLYPRKCSGGACYYDYLDELNNENEEESLSQDKTDHP